MSEAMDKFAPEVRERAIRMVADHENDRPSRWAAITSIAEKIGWVGPTLLESVGGESHLKTGEGKRPC